MIGAFVTILFATLVASVIAFLSGFGFLTIVMPTLALFLPIEMAIAITALVHLVHLLLKLSLTFKSVNTRIFLRFGLLATLFAIPGTVLLQYLSSLPNIVSYTLGSFEFNVTILKLALGALLIILALIESFKIHILQFTKILPSAVMSGFIGGLTGCQGVFRSVYLLNQNLSKNSYVATSGAISLLVDIVRVFFYLNLFPSWSLFIPDVLPAILGSTIGTLIALFFLKKITLTHIRGIVTILLYGFGIGFFTGLI